MLDHVGVEYEKKNKREIVFHGERCQDENEKLQQREIYF